MSGGLTVRDMVPEDAVELNLQLAQRVWLGSSTQPLTREYGQMLVEAGPAWTVLRSDGRVLASCGFGEHWPSYATCWALLAEGIGGDHLALTRIVRERMLAAPYARIEAIIRADHPAGRKWAQLVGLRDGGKRYECAGPEGEDFDLFELVDRAKLARADVPCGTLQEAA